METQHWATKDNYKTLCQQLGMEGMQLADGLQTMECKVDQIIRRQHVANELFEVKKESNRIKHDTTHCC